MKTSFKLVLVALLTLTSFSASKAGDKDLAQKESLARKAYKLCLPSLNSNIPGIVESTIYNIVLVKKYYPSADYSSIIEKLNEIADENNDPSIRFKAHLASIYLSFSDIIDVKPVSPSLDREYIFRQITEQLENKLLVSRN